MAKLIQHFDIGPGRAATGTWPFFGHRTMRQVLLDDGGPISKLIEVSQNVTTRQTTSLDVANTNERE